MCRIFREAVLRDGLDEAAAYKRTQELQAELDQIWARVPFDLFETSHPDFGSAYTAGIVLVSRFCLLRSLHLRFFVPGWLAPEVYGRSRDLIAEAAYDMVKHTVAWSHQQRFVPLAKALQRRTAPTAATKQSTRTPTSDYVETEAPYTEGKVETNMAQGCEDDLYVQKVHLKSGGRMTRRAVQAALLLQHHLFLMARHNSGPVALADRVESAHSLLAQFRELIEAAGPLWQIPVNEMQVLLAPQHLPGSNYVPATRAPFYPDPREFGSLTSTVDVAMPKAYCHDQRPRLPPIRTAVPSGNALSTTFPQSSVVSAGASAPNPVLWSMPRSVSGEAPDAARGANQSSPVTTQGRPPFQSPLPSQPQTNIPHLPQQLSHHALSYPQSQPYTQSQPQPPIFPPLSAPAQPSQPASSLEVDAALIMDQPWFAQAEPAGLLGVDMGAMLDLEGEFDALAAADRWGAAGGDGEGMGGMDPWWGNLTSTPFGA